MLLGEVELNLGNRLDQLEQLLGALLVADLFNDAGVGPPEFVLYDLELIGVEKLTEARMALESHCDLVREESVFEVEWHESVLLPGLIVTNLEDIVNFHGD